MIFFCNERNTTNFSAPIRVKFVRTFDSLGTETNKETQNKMCSELKSFRFKHSQSFADPRLRKVCVTISHTFLLTEQ